MASFIFYLYYLSCMVVENFTFYFLSTKNEFITCFIFIKKLYNSSLLLKKKKNLVEKQFAFRNLILFIMLIYHSSFCEQVNQHLLFFSTFHHFLQSLDLFFHRPPPGPFYFRVFTYLFDNFGLKYNYKVIFN